ncbi:acyltransferase [archaeon]|nr:MAG: acyltransferase [archaeon]
MKVANIQMRPEFLDREANLDHAARLLEQAREASIVVLPELFNTGYNFQEKGQVEGLAEDATSGPTSQMLQEIARDRDQYIAAGYAELYGGKVYNSQLFVGPEGFISSYKKVHLFYNEKKFFSSGSKLEVHSIGDINVGLMVCFDWFFPETMRSLMLMGADLMLHSANLVLPFCPNAMVTRCVENKVNAITSNRVGEEFGLRYIGMSQITAHDGTIVHRSPESEEEVWVADIDPMSGRDKSMNPLNNIIEDRRPDVYKLD